MEIHFLTLEEVVDIHEATLRRHGGAGGVRDPGGLSSALAMPQAGIGEEYFHSTLWEMAAAYAFHICMNHPFIDGNKRVGLLAALTFLEMNGREVVGHDAEIYDAMIQVASGGSSKAALAVLFEKLARPPTG